MRQELSRVSLPGGILTNDILAALLSERHPMMSKQHLKRVREKKLAIGIMKNFLKQEMTILIGHYLMMSGKQFH